MLKQIMLPIVFLFMISMLFCCGGCASYTAGIAPSTTPITNKDTYTVIGPAKARSWAVILYILPVSEPDMSGKARDRAIENSGGDALIEVSEEFNMWNFLLFSVCWTNCEGTAVKIQRASK